MFVYQQFHQFVYVGENTYFDCKCQNDIHSPCEGSYKTLHCFRITCHLRETAGFFYWLSDNHNFFDGNKKIQ